MRRNEERDIGGERGVGDLGKKYKKRGMGGVDKKLDKYTRM